MITPNTAPIHSPISHAATIKPAFLECVSESFTNHNEVLSLVVTTIAPIHTDKKDHTILNNILLNFIKTILKSDSFLTVVFVTKYLFTNIVVTVENNAKVIPATGCKEISLKVETTIPAFMKHYMKTLGCNFYDWVSDEDMKDDTMIETDKAKKVLIYALLFNEIYEVRFVLMKLNVDPPKFRTGQENRVIHMPTNPKV